MLHRSGVLSQRQHHQRLPHRQQHGEPPSRHMHVCGVTRSGAAVCNAADGHTARQPAATPLEQPQQLQQPQQQPLPSQAPSRRGMLQQLSGTAVLLGTSGLWAAALAPPGAAAAAGKPVRLEGDVAAAVNKALDKFVTKQKAAVLLRLAYHDAASHTQAGNRGGANASIQYELDRPENFGLKRGWNVIEQIAASLAGTPAAGAVSRADLVALAGARAVALCGGPVITLPIGRLDATAADPPNLMASEQSSAAALKANFADKGFSVQQMVALSGAHTLGSKGFGDPVTFDNAYFSTLLAKPWLNTADEMATHIGLPSDHALPEDEECLGHIRAYAADQGAFFRDFAAAYTRMTALGTGWA